MNRSQIKDDAKATLAFAEELGLSTFEYQYVCQKLEREPTVAEAAIFSAMFSEHCSYKSSKPFLKRFPTKGARVLQGPGENAGILDVGHGWAIAFKMESHNHPSFIEPFQGAATGVGGILRDIFTMGARPIASMNALCFGKVEAPRMASIMQGVVHGIGHYGNCVGVPTVAGQTFFHPSYNQNPLVNAFSLGIVQKDKILKGISKGEGNLVVYVGSKTGRDGVHGASMASKEFSSEEELERPTVQVGDPFTEKRLLEATLEARDLGLMVGIQDMGAAGLTSSSFEMAYRGKTGMHLELDKIPVREPGMSAYELLLSESQERMLLVAEPKNWEALSKVFVKWDLHAEVIGKVINTPRMQMYKDGVKVVDLPVSLVVDPPMRDLPRSAPSDLKQRWFYDRNKLLAQSLETKIQSLLEDYAFADPTPLVRQYDSTVGNRTEGGTFDDASVIRLRDIPNASVRLALTSDCNPRVCWLSPREGGRRAVAEAALNVAVRGAEPIGITDCLNFGNPENPEILWQFEEAIEGLAEACEALKIPVISGNVSLYNDTDGKPIHPTPMVGLVGIIEDNLPLPHSKFYSSQLEIGLMGPAEGGLGGSVFLSRWFGRDCGEPETTELTLVDRAIKALHKIRKKKIECAMHDVSDGGLLSCILEMIFRSPIAELGADIQIPREVDVDRFLFGESLPRIVLAYDSVERVELEMLASQAGLKLHPIGQTNESGKFVLRQGGAAVYEKPISVLADPWKTKWSRVFKL